MTLFSFINEQLEKIYGFILKRSLSYLCYGTKGGQNLKLRPNQETYSTRFLSLSHLMLSVTLSASKSKINENFKLGFKVSKLSKEVGLNEECSVFKQNEKQ